MKLRADRGLEKTGVSRIFGGITYETGNHRLCTHDRLNVRAHSGKDGSACGIHPSPLIAAACAGFGMEDIAGFVKTGMNSMLSTEILFVFSISYFTLMSDKGLFDPIINFLIKK